MVHAGEVQDAVDDGLQQILGVLGADDDVAELAQAVAANTVGYKASVGRFQTLVTSPATATPTSNTNPTT